MNPIYTIEDENRIPYGFFMEEKDRDDAYEKYVQPFRRWGIKGKK